MTPSKAETRCKNTWHTVPYLVLYDMSMICACDPTFRSPPLPSLPLKIQCASSLTLESSLSFSRDSSDRDTLVTWDFDFRPIKTKHNIIMWNKCFRGDLKTSFRLSAEWVLRAWQKALTFNQSEVTCWQADFSACPVFQKIQHCIVFVSVDCRLV